jgi:DNA-binding transcriptional LysR family regulator
MDRVDLFRIFTRVAEAGSFTHAAHTLGLPRSSVSAAVQELEARLGTRLLNRTTRRVALTADGEALTPARRTCSPISRRPRGCSASPAQRHPGASAPICRGAWAD